MSKKPAKKKRNHKGPKPMTKDGFKMLDLASHVPMEMIQNDIGKATRKDPQNCPQARCLTREHRTCKAVGTGDTFKIKKGVVYHTVAHLYATNTRTGEEVVIRGKLSRAAEREALVQDRGGSFKDGPAIYVKPPSKGALLGARTGANVPGARDRGSRDRTPSRRRPPGHDYDMREAAPTNPT